VTSGNFVMVKSPEKIPIGKLSSKQVKVVRNNESIVYILSPKKPGHVLKQEKILSAVLYCCLVSHSVVFTFIHANLHGKILTGFDQGNMSR
jgi:hypothetical protein